MALRASTPASSHKALSDRIFFLSGDSSCLYLKSVATGSAKRPTSSLLQWALRTKADA